MSRLAVPLFLIIGIILRILGGNGELWLDEVWSLDIAKGLSSIWQVLNATSSDNNHPINTAFLTLVQNTNSPWIFRSLSILCSVISLLLYYQILKRIAPAYKDLSLLFFALSYPFILYGSEPRGYAPMIAALLGAIYLLDKQHREPFTQNLIAFWVLITLGMLSHPSFLISLIALMLWSMSLFLRAKINSKVFITLHGLPILLAIGYFYLFISKLPPGTGTLLPWAAAISDTLNLAIGGPLLSLCSEEFLPASLLLGFIALSILAFQLVSIRRELHDHADLILLLTLVVPIICLVFIEPRLLYPRYFLGALIFTPILVARAIQRGWNSRNYLMIVGSIALTVGFLAGNSFYLYNLISFGRGNYSGALEYIITHTATSPILVGGNNEFRNLKMIKYLKSSNSKFQSIEYSSDAAQAEWYLAQSAEYDESTIAPSIDISGRIFQARGLYPTAPLSGLKLILYESERRQ